MTHFDRFVAFLFLIILIDLADEFPTSCFDIMMSFSRTDLVLFEFRVLLRYVYLYSLISWYSFIFMLRKS